MSFRFWIIPVFFFILGVTPLAIFLTYPERWFKSRFFQFRVNKKDVYSDIEETLQNSAAHGPRITLISDPRPMILGVRSLGSLGRIFISAGMISILNSEEMNSALEQEIRALTRFMTPLRTGFLFCAILFYRMTPRAWRSLENQEPRSAFSFLLATVCLAFSEFFGNLAGQNDQKVLPERLMRFSQIFMQSENLPRFIPLTFL